jgi:putative phage-type endonuclease
MSIDPFSQREEWLAWRRQGIGGSDAPILMGLNQYRGALSLYVDKMDRGLDPSEPNEAAYWGSTLEDMVAQEFGRRTGLDVRRPPTFNMRHPVHTFMQGTPDRFVYRTSGDDEPIGILELKTCTLRKEWDWDPDPPPAAVCQLRHYLAVAGMELGWLACLIGGQRYIHHEVRRDPAFEAEMIAKEEAFWYHVTNDIPPEPDGRDSTTAIINQRYQDVDPQTFVDLGVEEDYRAAVEEVVRLSRNIREDKVRLEAVKNQLKLALGSSEVGTLDGSPVVSWKGGTREILDARALRREAPGIAEQYTRVVNTRTFRVHTKRRVDLTGFDPEDEDQDDDDDGREGA